MDNRECSVDMFATTLEGMLDDIPQAINNGLPKIVRKALLEGRREAMDRAATLPVHQGKTMNRYVKGFHTHMKGQGLTSRNIEGVLSNDDMPGLVHLLEKGHAKVGGGRTRSFPHMKQAKKVTDDYLIEKIDGLVDKAIR